MSVITVSMFSILFFCISGRGSQEEQSHPASHLPQYPGIENSLSNAPASQGGIRSKSFAHVVLIVLKCRFANPRMKEFFQCSLAHRVLLQVSICLDICSHHWDKVLVQSVLLHLLWSPMSSEGPSGLPYPFCRSGPAIHYSVFSSEEIKFLQVDQVA